MLPPYRFLVVFNPLEQERLSVVPVLVDSPHVRVLSEEGQPLPSQLSATWSSATDVVPDVYQVWGAPHPRPIVPASHPAHSQDTLAALLCPCPATQDLTAVRPPGSHAWPSSAEAPQCRAGSLPY